MEVDELLREQLFEVVEKQIEENDPPETRETFDRLRAAGYGGKEAKRMIAQVLVVETHTILSEGSPFNRERFARMLKELPSPPEEHWD